MPWLLVECLAYPVIQMFSFDPVVSEPDLEAGRFRIDQQQGVDDFKSRLREAGSILLGYAPWRHKG